jgi:type III pantothenate kinase
MLILLDIGNTSVTYGFYGNGRLHRFGSCLYDSVPYIINNLADSGKLDSNNHIVISSVVPKITQFVKRSIFNKKGFKLWIIGENLRISIPHRYISLKKLGSDRLVNLYGAIRIYKPPILVIDFGTGVTFDYVSRKGVFEGGMIIPGPQISFQALLARTALIPKELRLPTKSSSFIGRNTQQCVTSGILEGYGSMTDELVSRFKSKFGKSLRVLVTGGYAGAIKPFSNEFQIYDPRHSIKSLLIIFKDFQKTLMSR